LLKCLYIRIANTAIIITGTTDTRIVSNRPSIDATGIMPSFIGYDYYQDTIIPPQRLHGKRFYVNPDVISRSRNNYRPFPNLMLSISYLLYLSLIINLATPGSS
jgi:hypothetical protein